MSYHRSPKSLLPTLLVFTIAIAVNSRLSNAADIQPSISPDQRLVSDFNRPLPPSNTTDLAFRIRLKVFPHILRFGPTKHTTKMHFTVTNRGITPLTITISDVHQPFSILTPLPLHLPPSTSHVIRVALSPLPLPAGKYTDDLLLLAYSPTNTRTAHIRLRGHITPPPPQTPLFVTQPPYNARGDGVTCDDAAIQAAVNAACSTSGFLHPNVIIPYSSEPYLLCHPIAIFCSLTVIGAGPKSSAIKTNYEGPAFLMQTTDPLHPLYYANVTTSVTAPWTASTPYPQYAEVRDGNGNIEVAITAGTSRASSPNWPLTIGAHTPDGSVTWSLATIGDSLVGGPGAAFDGMKPWTAINLNDVRSLNLNGLSALTVEFFMNVVGYNVNSYEVLMGSERAIPTSSPGNGAFKLFDSCWSGPSSCSLTASVYTSGSGLVTVAAPINLDTVYHVALVYNGTVLSLFLNGTVMASTPATGHIVQTHYENIAVGTQNSVFPASHPWTLGVQGYLDSIRVSDFARYTAPFKTPTEKFGGDNHTLLLLNFPAGTPLGTYGAISGNRTTPNIYIPYQIGDGAHLLGNASISGLELCAGGGDDGIYATWTINSTFSNLVCTYPDSYMLYFANNDYEDNVENVWAGALYNDNGVRAGVRTSAMFIFGDQAGGNIYDGLHCDNANTCIIEYSASGLFVAPEILDRGGYIYPVVISESTADLLATGFDFESSNSRFVSGFYVDHATVDGVMIDGGDIVSPNPNGTLLTVSGGGAIVAQSVAFGGVAQYVVNVLSPPQSPVILEYDSFGGIPAVDPADAQYVKIVN